MDVSETKLPGVGLRYEFTTRHGEHMGIVLYRDGKVDLMVFDTEDPDLCKGMLSLSHSEAETVAEILGAPRITEHVADLTKEVPGLASSQIRLPESSRYAGRCLGDTKCRTRTGASVVAIVRSDEVISSPPPEQGLQAGDVLVVIGSVDAVAAARDLLGASDLGA